VAGGKDERVEYLSNVITRGVENLRRLGLPEHEVEAMESVLREVACVEPGELCRRPWQGRAAAQALARVMEGEGVVLARAPTGSGKTLFAVLTGLLYQLARGEVIRVGDGRVILAVPSVVYIAAVSEHARRYVEDYWRIIGLNVIRRVGRTSRKLLATLATLSPIPYNSTIYSCPVVAVLDAVEAIDAFDEVVDKIDRGICGMSHRKAEKVSTYAAVIATASITASGLEPWRLAKALAVTREELLALTGTQAFIDVGEAAKRLKGGATLYLPAQAFTCPVALIRKPFPTRVFPMASIHQSLKPDICAGLASDHSGLRSLGRVVVENVTGLEWEEVVAEAHARVASMIDEEAPIAPKLTCEPNSFDVNKVVCRAEPSLVVVDEAHRLIEPHRYSGDFSLGIYGKTLSEHVNELPSEIVRVGRSRCGRVAECLKRFEAAAESWRAWVEEAVKWVNKEVIRLAELLDPESTKEAKGAPVGDEPRIEALRNAVEALAEPCLVELGDAGAQDLKKRVDYMLSLLRVDKRDKRNGAYSVELYRAVRRVAARLGLIAKAYNGLPKACKALREVLNAASIYIFNALVSANISSLVEAAHWEDRFVEVGSKKYPVVIVGGPSNNCERISEGSGAQVRALLILKDVSSASVDSLSAASIEVGYVKEPEPLGYGAAILMSGTLPRFVGRVANDEDPLYIDATGLGARTGEIMVVKLGHYVTLRNIEENSEKYVELILRSVSNCKPAVVFMTSNDYAILRRWAEEHLNDDGRAGELARRFIELFPEIIMNNVKRLEQLLREKGVAASSLFSTLSESMEVVRDGASMIRCVVILRLTSGEKSEHSEVARKLIADFYGVDKEVLDVIVTLIRAAQVLGRSVRSERDRATAVVVDGVKMMRMVSRLGRDVLKEIGFAKFL